jgi:hypothetical protein
MSRTANSGAAGELAPARPATVTRGKLGQAKREVEHVDTVVMDWLRIGLSAAGVILLLKLIFLRLHVPGLSPAVAAI